MLPIAFKPEVRLISGNLTPSMIAVLQAVADTAPTMQGNLTVITSAADGQHHPGSLHPYGFAFDVRAFGLREGAIAVPNDAGFHDAQIVAAKSWIERLRVRLGPAYDVLLEADQTHIHIEYDPTHTGVKGLKV